MARISIKDILKDYEFQKGHEFKTCKLHVTFTRNDRPRKGSQMTEELEVQKALWLYSNDNQVEGFYKLLSLTTNGVPLAQYHLGLMCQENQLLFLASDIWQDLLDHKVQPRRPVAELLYEIYSWTGDIPSTEDLIKKEKLSSFKKDLASRNYVSDRQKTASMAGGFLVAERKASKLLEESWSYEESLKLLEAKANLSVIASQVAYSQEPFVGGASVLVSGSDIWTEDLEERLNDAVASWKSVRSCATELISELSQIGDEHSSELAKVASVALEAQERLFFFAGNMAVEDKETKSAVNNIACALQRTNKVASNYYSGLAGN